MTVNKTQLIANAVRRLGALFPGYFGGGNAKHTNMYAEYGYPEAPTFDDFYRLYKRNGVARGAINKTINKTWQTAPYLLEGDSVHEENARERAARDLFNRIHFWNKLKEADRKSMVGRYAGVIFRFADGKPFSEPVEGLVPGGANGLIEVIPVYEEQLKPTEYDNDEASTTYGMPKMYSFQESAISSVSHGAGRSVNVHPSRVHIWSETFDIHGESSLEAGINSLLDLEKIAGAGGEGFWKNAKNAPVLNIDKEADPQRLADMFGVAVDELPDKMDEVVGDWQRGFDQLLMLQGIQTQSLAVTLPQPEQFVQTSLMVFAASFGIPMKILLGSQTGERASTEDADEWAETIMGRRAAVVVPNVMAIIARLEEVGVIPTSTIGWNLDWADLTEASASEKVERADKMASINQKMLGRGEVYTPDEIREVTGHEPLGDGGEEGEELDDE